jgi:alpha-D-xyloside xylohydrolase
MSHRTSLLLPLLALATACAVPDNPQPITHISQPAWKQVLPGTYIAEVGKPSAFNLLSVANREPRVEAIKVLGDAPVPIDLKEIGATVVNGRTCLRFPLDRDEQVYGFGLNFKTINQRGRIMRLHVDHYGREDDGRTHAPVPFFVSSKGYGVLVNAARYIDVSVGSAVRKDSRNPPVTRDRNTDPAWDAQPYSDNIEMVVPEKGVEMILFTGKNMMEVVQRFNLYCGGGVIPPKWGLGFWQRTPTLYGENEVGEEAAAFEKNNFPLDVIGLEPGWHSKSYPCTFEWDPGRFPGPENFIKEMTSRGLRLNLWMNPYLWPDGTLDKQLQDFTGSHTVWCGTVPDYTIPTARKIMQDHFTRDQLDIGVSGFKIDEVDGVDSWLWPDGAVWPSGRDGEQMRQTYGLQMMTLLDEIYRVKNERTYGLIRAANAGSVSYPYVIYNDNYSHQEFIIALINSGFSGLLWTPEVRASGSSEEWLRRMQTVCFSPMAMINAWADGTKPWSFPDVYKSCQEVAFLRMQLLPYLYSSFAQYYLEGKPVFRAMQLVEGFQYQGDIKDQYMLGGNLLVAPLFTGETGRKVILPPGKWYDFYTGELAGEGTITVKGSLDRIPLFVRDGGLIPMIPSIRQTREWTRELPLEVRIYGTAAGSFNLYNDDGGSFNFEKGEYTMQHLKFENGKGTSDISGSGAFAYPDFQWNMMTKKE